MQDSKFNKANLRDLVAVTSLVILLKIGLKSSIFRSVWPSNLMDDLAKQQGTSSALRQALCIISYPLVNSKWRYSPEILNLGQNWRFSVLCDLEIWWMTLKNNRSHPLCYFKLFKSFQSHLWIQTTATVRKPSIQLKVSDICPLWPWNMMDDLEKQLGTSSMLLQDLGIISQPSVNSNWSYSPKNPNFGPHQ